MVIITLITITWYLLHWLRNNVVIITLIKKQRGNYDTGYETMW